MALTTQSTNLNGQVKSIITAQDGSGNIAAAHVTVDSSGAEKGITANPLYVGVSDGTNTALVANGSAAQSETASDRLKVGATLRLLDTTQSAGSQLVAAKGDQTNGLWVRPVNGLTITATTVSLTAGTSTQLIAANGARRFLAVFFLSSTATGYLTPGATATAANGLPLGAAPSGSVSLGQAYEFTGAGVPTGAVNMLCASAVNVIVWEGV